MNKSAVISECGLFRYMLLRQWDNTLPVALVIMLNPSRADAMQDDHTIRKLYGFAKRLGWGGFVVVNLYAYRATSPRDMLAQLDPIGPRNDEYLKFYLRLARTVVCAWGVNATAARAAHVRSMILDAGRTPQALKVTASGIPCHPLMLPYSCQLAPI